MRFSHTTNLLRSFALAAMLFAPLIACEASSSLRHKGETLPLFNPHRPDFICSIEAEKVPVIDAQAEAWFQEAQALEDPSIYEDDRDYKKIVTLTQQAAERHHWKAMLNLASLYVENRDPNHNAQDAVKLVNDAMRLGIPAAYDRMGTYYLIATGVKGDSTKAYAFFQRAAEMGNPNAMTFLGEKISATWDNPAERFWANYPVALKMLECALGQGHGQAAYELHFLYAKTRAPDGKIIGDGTPEEKAHALRTLQQGVKLGCANCASALASAFRSPESKADALVPDLDEARSKRYYELSYALSFNPNRRFPNLDKVLPLPPAKLPPWDGTRKSLVKDAMGVAQLSSVPAPGASSQLKARHYVAAEFTLRHSNVKTTGLNSPAPAYWQPTAPEQDTATQSVLATVPPGLYLLNEPFERFHRPNGGGRLIDNVVWERWDTIRHNHYEVDPRAAAGLTRTVPPPIALTCTATDLCPATGIWQPWVQPDHPLSSIVNQPWRQAWLTQGQPFPQADQDWLLNLPAGELTWHLMEEGGEAVG